MKDPTYSPKYQANEKGMYECPECKKELKSPKALGGHRFHAHGVKGIATSAKAAREKKEPKVRKPKASSQREGYTLPFRHCPCCDLDLVAAQIALEVVKRGA